MDGEDLEFLQKLSLVLWRRPCSTSDDLAVLDEAEEDDVGELAHGSTLGKYACAIAAGLLLKGIDRNPGEVVDPRPRNLANGDGFVNVTEPMVSRRSLAIDSLNILGADVFERVFVVDDVQAGSLNLVRLTEFVF